MATDSQAIVTATDVHRRFGEGDAAVEALDGVSVDFPKGRFTAIMGPSGSGKSTLMHVLAGLDRPTSGSVVVDGTEISDLDDKQLTELRRDKVGFVFQFFNLLPVLTAQENIVLPLSIAGRKPDEALLGQLVEAVDLGDRLSHRPSELSGGQQQRVAVARALISKPAVVFADEPTGNLDSQLQRGGAQPAAPRRGRVRPDRRDGHPRPQRRGRSPTACWCWWTARSCRTPRRATPSACTTCSRPAPPSDRGRAAQPLVAQAPHVPHLAGDRPRRDDGRGHLRAHGHDRPLVRQDLHRVEPGHRRRGQLARGRGDRRRPGARRSRPRCSTWSARPTGVAQASGGIFDPQVAILDKDGEPHRRQRRADVRRLGRARALRRVRLRGGAQDRAPTARW